MLRRSTRFLLVAAALTAATSVTSAAQAEYRPPTALMGDGGPVIPLKNAAMIVRTEGGYRYIAGQQNSHLTVSIAQGKLRYVDTGTRELRDIPKSCSRVAASKGVAALCSIPAKFDGREMYLEIWPRLGDDFVDGSTVPSRFKMWVLADAGFDTVRGGDGDDFVNGAQDADKVWGGAGNDWIRTGIGNDSLWGGSGDDKLVGVEGRDEIRGGDGNDRVGGGAGNDSLWGDAGRDILACGGGRDNAYVDASDRTNKCESVARR